MIPDVISILLSQLSPGANLTSIFFSALLPLGFFFK